MLTLCTCSQVMYTILLDQSDQQTREWHVKISDKAPQHGYHQTTGEETDRGKQSVNICTHANIMYMCSGMYTALSGQSDQQTH